MDIIDEIAKVIKITPNDCDLGRKIREIVLKLTNDKK